MEKFQRSVIELVKSALTDTTCTVDEDFSLEDALKLAKKHCVSSMLYYGAIKSGIDQSLPQMMQLFTDVCMHVSVSENQLHQLQLLFKAFDENGVEYLPVKGSVMKGKYPKADMRVMSDADILIRTEQYDTIKSVMLSLGYEEGIESDHELVWKKPPMHMELHKRLIPSYNKDYFAYYGDGWKLAVPAGDSKTRYTMKPEDEFIYIFTHFAKHYRDGGIGIRHMTDLWIFLRDNPALDAAYMKSELDKLQLFDFYESITETLDVWFAGAEDTAKTDLITSIILNSGQYGTKEAKLLSIAYRDTKKGENLEAVKTKKFLRKVFLPYKFMVKKYPILKKCPVLLPVMWVVRIVNVVVLKRDKISSQIALNNLVTEEKTQDFAQALKLVGLDFNFEE